MARLFSAAATAFSVAIALAHGTKGQINNPRSYNPDSYSCSNTGIDAQENTIYALDYNCDSMMPPSSWQKRNTDVDVVQTDYDLIVIGGGIGGAYLVNRLIEEFQKKNQEPPKIALFERANTIGGRLMSAYGSGALGLSVQPRTQSMEPMTLQEYGGMRVDPYRYPLLFHKIIMEGQALFGADNCKQFKDCDFGTNCCPDMLSRMEVGGVRYATTRTDLGVLGESTVSNSSLTYNVTGDGRVVSSYTLADIAKGTGTPFDKCVQLTVAAEAFYRDLDDSVKSTTLFKTAIEDLCLNCEASGIDGMCPLCEQFPKPAEAVISCSGYDLNTNSATLSSVIHFVDEVLNVRRETHLYVFRAGFQRFVMGLLEKGSSLISPYLHRTLTEVSVDNDPNATASLAQAQASLLSAPAQQETVPSQMRITTRFTDGSSVNAKAVYMGMLPYDLPGIKGFESWDEPLSVVAKPSLAAKIVFGWKDASKALPALLGLRPCVPGPCERLILDGDSSQGWMPRQVWLWNNNTIMIYDVGSVSNANVTYPAYTISDSAAKNGMNYVVTTIMAQIRNATGLTIEDPDWARLKSWPEGTFTAWQEAKQNETYGTDPVKFSAHISRPLGYDVPVYYGNSEAAADGNNHGWAEGALEMVEDNLQSLATYLGLEGQIESPSRDKVNVTMALEEWEAEQVEKSPTAQTPGHQRRNLRKIRAAT